jgi:hypothetical protein
MGLYAGNSYGTDPGQGSGGQFIMYGGAGYNGGNLVLQAGYATNTPGNVFIQGGNILSVGYGSIAGNVYLQGGDVGSGVGTTGKVIITGKFDPSAITGNVDWGTNNLTTTGTLGAGAITGTSLIKSGGTSSQFLKADGSVDSSAYTIGGLLATGATTGATSQIQAFTDGVLAGTTNNNLTLSPVALNTPSYTNLASIGMRNSIITVTSNVSLGGGSLNRLTQDSVYGNSTLWYNTQTCVGKYFRFDFGIPTVMNEAIYYQQTTNTHGTWKWQGSVSDGTTWVDIGATFVFGAVSQTFTQLNANTTAYRYYRILGTVDTPGGMSNNPYIYGFDFRVDNARIVGMGGVQAFKTNGATAQTIVLNPLSENTLIPGNLSIGQINNTASTARLSIFGNKGPGLNQGVLEIHADDARSYPMRLFIDLYDPVNALFSYYGDSAGNFFQGTDGAAAMSLYTNGYTNPRITISATGVVTIPNLTTGLVKVTAGVLGTNTTTYLSTLTTATPTNLTGFIKGNGSVLSADNSTYVSTLTTSTPTNLTGFIKGNGSVLSVDNSTYSSRVYNANLTGQHASIGSTTIASATGLYRIMGKLECTTGNAGATSVSLNIQYTDDAGAAAETLSSLVLTATGRSSFLGIAQLASGNLTFTTTWTDISGLSRYSLYLSAEQIN